MLTGDLSHAPIPRWTYPSSRTTFFPNMLDSIDANQCSTLNSFRSVRILSAGDEYELAPVRNPAAARKISLPDHKKYGKLVRGSTRE
jgi:hypothetical protein